MQPLQKSLGLHAVQVGALRFPLHCLGEGEPVLFLHGFPERGRYWWPLAAALQTLGAGVQCWMPDLRGCGAASAPADPEDYAPAALMRDVIGILDALKLHRVHLVGHDWGGVLAWLFANRHPERLHSLAVCNAPHPVPFQERLLSDPAQREASVYLTRLQAAGAGRGLLAAGGEALWSRLRGSGVGFDAEDRSAWLAHWAQPDALDGAVAWYRASPFQRPDQPDPQAQTWHREQDLGVKVPTLIIWGERDTTFVPALAEESAAQCQSVRLLRLADVHHNPPREASTACAEALASFWKTVDLGSSAIDESFNSGTL